MRLINGLPDLKKAPHFSLLVPCYNAAAYIDGFFENILKLHIPFDEMIFYDDASTDATAQMIRSKGYRVLTAFISMISMMR